uniref:Uncharacterized protein n=1 Tax=Porodaedalea pini TaxID=108901 RepID=A0A5B9RC40_9AGAM|nr:hypothetical protein PPIT_000080 [Porodaedalea pini]QEG56963.1 hypothetical protein PPIT_000080 [Porodaedalea pini]
MMNINLNINFLITNILLIFVVSFVLHFCVFYSMQIGLFGVKIQNKYITYFKQNSLLFIIIPFVISFLILNYMEYNTILLDDKPVIIKASVGDTEVELTGEFFKTILTNLGAAGVYASSARIAAALVSKTNLKLLPRIGIIGGTSTGFTASYLVLTNTIHSFADTVVTAPTGKVKLSFEIKDLKTAGGDALNTEQAKNVLSRWVDEPSLLKNNKFSNFVYKNLEDRHEITVNSEQTSRVVSELNTNDPDWINKFINSPLEKGDILNIPFVKSVIEIISTNLILHFVIIYLLIMLVIIFSCKIIIDKEINFNKVLDYPLGKYIHKFLTFYVNIWRNSANIWIYFILFCLIIFNCSSAYSFYKILAVTL